MTCFFLGFHLVRLHVLLSVECRRSIAFNFVLSSPGSQIAISFTLSLYLFVSIRDNLKKKIIPRNFIKMRSSMRNWERKTKNGCTTTMAKTWRSSHLIRRIEWIDAQGKGRRRKNKRQNTKIYVYLKTISLVCKKTCKYAMIQGYIQRLWNEMP